ncbi:hypothetical protein TEA_003804 [Camellia sinensis var. sinensis]|uniref:Fatty acid hydroxylase domain-containing protein n=1 Tax=Camellia sinensis var. sinensis TaxID=542762 RepID=A0A4S4DX64_CAMSN|nr:hypothetical protein TEA_003804 [Camellia sinensis var. sinensis]
MGSMACYIFPALSNLPLWESRSFIAAMLLHIGVSEPLYYCLHKCFHAKYLFTHYHSLHHSSPVPQPFTAGSGTFLEHLILSGVIGIPVFGSCVIGYGSIGMIYGYVLIFDFLRCLGHCNVEIVPYQLFDRLPFLKYLLYTPTYHSLHHTETGTNYCLFMPLYDALGNTLNSKSWDLHKTLLLNSGKNWRVPDFVFLAHVVDITASLRSQVFVFRSFASKPFRTRIFLLPIWPLAFTVMLVMWAKSKPFSVSFYNLRGRLHHTWAVPRFGFQYFLPFAREGINKHIEEAILRADRLGVKVLTLAALNKNEALNGGGMLFVNKHPNLKVRVVHGNTLTAAVTLNQIPKDVDEVFLTGATSNLSNCPLPLQTESTSDFGKWITPREQSWAPAGTHFHQFVVPPILPFRRDCTYSDLAAMKFPDDVRGLGYCEENPLYPPAGLRQRPLQRSPRYPVSHSEQGDYNLRTCPDLSRQAPLKSGLAQRGSIEPTPSAD